VDRNEALIEPPLSIEGWNAWLPFVLVSNEPANKLLCDRHLQGRRSVAFERGAAHVAHLARLPIASVPMHSLAVVPHHEIILPPGVGVNELSPGRVLDKIAHKGHCFRHRPADKAANVGRAASRRAPTKISNDGRP
jgi:hypothetical protein